jgi:hypothetical protein
MERSPFSLFRGYNCPKKSCSKIKWTSMPLKYTKWFLSISSEMKRIQNLEKGGLHAKYLIKIKSKK